MNDERLFHINITREQGAEYAILPGDPGRVPKIAAYLDNAQLLAQNREFISYAGDAYRYAALHYTETPLKIMGVAISPTIEYVFLDWESHPEWFLDSIQNWHEYVQLLKRDSAGVHVLAEAPYDFYWDTTRWWKFDGDTGLIDWDTEQSLNSRTYIPILEVYFDKPITVTDTFFVGVTNNYFFDKPDFLHFYNVPIGYLSINNTYQWYHVGPRGLIALPPREQQGVLEWIYGPISHELPIIWAIFDTTGMGLTPPDTCREVENFRCSVFGDMVRLAWDDTVHDEWQLAWGLASSSPDSYRLMPLRNTYKVLEGLEHNVRYAARVRAKCPNGNTSEWSDTIQFMLGSEGVESPVGRSTRVMPNPAHGNALVVSDYPIRSIEVYGVDGRKLQEQTGTGREETIDLSALPKGTYIVHVVTSHGKTTKKLSVE